MARSGSIPAGAGEPAWRLPSRHRRGVYPRGCGGARVASSAGMSTTGLSPRVRGSPHHHARQQRRGGSIPAGAGEPHGNNSEAVSVWVYPRGCGGAPLRRLAKRGWLGLSPRVRGSRRRNEGRRSGYGSIPAGAGEPTASRRTMGRGWVYPRGCGGAAGANRAQAALVGLSPRVRGSPAMTVTATGHHGSIPAGAGEPKQSHGLKRSRRVYPRGCGGARPVK